jgi:hypothetical protein
MTGAPTTTVRSAQMLFSYPHLIHVGGVLRLPQRARPFGPSAWDVGLALRLSVPPRADLEIRLERRPSDDTALPPRIFTPLSQRAAALVDISLRQHWSGFSLAQALLWESPRTDGAAVSAANLEGQHKLDLALSARLGLGRALTLSLSMGATWHFFADNAGQGYNPSAAALCRQNPDVASADCLDVQLGWARPSAAGHYALAVFYGGAGIELRR